MTEIIAMPRKVPPLMCAGLCFAVAIFLLCCPLLNIRTDGNEIWGAGGLAFGGMVFLWAARRPTIMIRDDVLVILGVKIPTSSLVGVRIVYVEWEGKQRCMELLFSKSTRLPWHVHLFDPLRTSKQRRNAGYRRPRRPYLTVVIYETDRTDDEILRMLRARILTQTSQP